MITALDITAINSLTVTQLLLAAGKARNMNISTLCHHCGCSEAYFYKMIKNKDFLQLIEWMRAADADNDNLKFVNVGTLMADAGKFLYHAGIKKINGENDE